MEPGRSGSRILLMGTVLIAVSVAAAAQSIAPGQATGEGALSRALGLYVKP